MLEKFTRITFLNNRLLDYIIFLGVFILGILIVRIFKSIFLNRLKKWSNKKKAIISNFLLTVEKHFIPFLYFGIFYISVKRLTLSKGFDKAFGIITLVVLTFFAIRMIIAIINYSVKGYLLKKKADDVKQRSLQGIFTVIKVLIWGYGIIFLLDNLGFKISTVLAGLGIGGVAVALAAQAVLGDLFSFFAILFDRPFEVGDFIIIGEYLGVVEHVGIKTTRIRSLSGEQLVFSNTDLTNSRVRNYKRMEKRRVVFKIGVVYGTPLKKMQQIPEIIKKIIKNIKETEFDRSHFFSYGNFSLDIETVYYVMGSDYNKYMDIQQKINFEIMKEFQKYNIEFAYPTQTLYVSKQK